LTNASLVAALKYLGMGWSVLPLMGKKPFGNLKWEQFQKRRPSVSEVQDLFKKYPSANIGIILGKVSGRLCVVDIDDPVLAEKILKTGIVDKTRVVKTKRGIHIFLLETEAESSPIDFRRYGIEAELRADGQYVAAVPSPDKEWLSEGSLLEVKNVALWAADLLKVDPSKLLNQPAKGEMPEEFSEGIRDISFFILASKLANVAGFGAHHLQVMLDALNQSFAKPPLKSKQIAEKVQSALKYRDHSSRCYSSVYVGNNNNTVINEFAHLTTIAEKTPKKVDWLWDGYLGRGLLTLLYSEPRAGKSRLIRCLLSALYSHQPLLGLSTKLDGKILWITEEPAEVLIPYLEERGLVRDDIEVMCGVSNWYTVLVQVEEKLEQEKIALVIIDSLTSFWNVLNESDATEIKKCFNPLRWLTHTYKPAVLLVHHLNKKQAGFVKQTARGSNALVLLTDVGIEMSGNGKRDSFSLKAASRCRETTPELSFEFKENECVAVSSENSKQEGRSHEVWKEIPLVGNRGITVRELQVSFPHLNPKSFYEILDEGVRKQVLMRSLEREGKHSKNNPYVFNRKVNGQQKQQAV